MLKDMNSHQEKFKTCEKISYVILANCKKYPDYKEQMHSVIKCVGGEG
jgi:hypothetical protein